MDALSSCFNAFQESFNEGIFFDSQPRWKEKLKARHVGQEAVRLPTLCLLLPVIVLFINWDAGLAQERDGNNSRLW